MINKITLPLIAIILLSSCAGKFGLQKRRYTKGYYFSVAKHNSKPATHETAKTTSPAVVKNTSSKNEATVIASSFAKAEAQPVQAAEFAKAPAAARPAAVKHSSSKHLTASSSHKASLAAAKAAFRPVQVAASKRNAPHAKASGGANLVLMVILCLFAFINLIPVYIHDQHSVTLNFWLTLILDFTYLGGVIYSLLVVLDVVDLSK